MSYNIDKNINESIADESQTVAIREPGGVETLVDDVDIPDAKKKLMHPALLTKAAKKKVTGKEVNRRGYLAEARFQAEALAKGLVVCQPFGNYCAYDFIVDNGKKLLKIQVKSTHGKWYRKERDSGYFVKLQPDNDQDWYTSDGVDFFAAYVAPTDTWYFVPLADAKKVLWLSPRSPKLKYLEAWHYLLESA